MTAFNVVRFKVKPGMEEDFLAVHRDLKLDTPQFAGFWRGCLMKTGDSAYCFVGEWDSADDSLAAESAMVEVLDRFRYTLEDQGPGIGVTDAVVGDAIFKY